MKYKISQHLLILYSLTELSDPIGYSLNFYISPNFIRAACVISSAASSIL